MAGHIVVSRSAANDIKMRDFYIEIDGLPMANLKHGDSHESDIEPGPHKLLATNKLYSKDLEFQIAEGETITFQAANVPGGCLGFMIVVFGIGPYKVQFRKL